MTPEVWDQMMADLERKMRDSTGLAKQGDSEQAVISQLEKALKNFLIAPSGEPIDISGRYPHKNCSYCIAREALEAAESLREGL